jgi:tRNA(Ile)-lysidine synthase
MKTPINQKFLEFFKRFGISTQSKKVLLACSSGLDSMVLGHLLIKNNFSPVIAHCNFNLRGAESNEDAEFVKKWAAQNNLSFYSKSLDTKTYSTDEHISTQMAARKLRYDFFDNLIQEHNLNYIATGHHADDSLETTLINIGRSTGFAGLSGINPINENIIRPLWQCSREEIKAYALENGIKWREDSSNATDDYQRNFIRHQVIPKLKEAKPSYTSGLINTIGNLNHDLSFFKFQLDKTIAELSEERGSSQMLHIPSLLKTSGFVAVLNHWLNRFGHFDLYAIIEGLDKESGQTYFSNGFELLKDREFLIIKKTEAPKELTSYPIKPTDKEVLEPVHLRILVSDKPKDFIPTKPLNEVNLDFDKLEFPLTLRRWENGDSFIPLGMKGRKKLQDFFTDIKLNRFEKEEVWLLCSGKNIVWVVGYRIDDRYKVTVSTKTIYFVRLVEA